MKTEYKLIVRGVGNYTADSLHELLWVVLKHRLHHLCNGEGWRD